MKISDEEKEDDREIIYFSPSFTKFEEGERYIEESIEPESMDTSIKEKFNISINGKH